MNRMNRMNRMHTVTRIAHSLVLSLGLVGTAMAQSGDFAEGEIRKVDKEAGKITLRHGEIKSLDMPPMTMVFVVKDPAQLAGLKAGDKVRFKAANEAGKYTVTDIQPVK